MYSTRQSEGNKTKECIEGFNKKNIYSALLNVSPCAKLKLVKYRKGQPN